MWTTNLRKANEVELPDRTAEIIARVAPNIFTNYFNNAGGVEVDFPKIALRHSPWSAAIQNKMRVGETAELLVDRRREVESGPGVS